MLFLFDWVEVLILICVIHVWIWRLKLKSFDYYLRKHSTSFLDASLSSLEAKLPNEVLFFLNSLGNEWSEKERYYVQKVETNLLNVLLDFAEPGWQWSYGILAIHYLHIVIFAPKEFEGNWWSCSPNIIFWESGTGCILVVIDFESMGMKWSDNHDSCTILC